MTYLWQLVVDPEMNRTEYSYLSHSSPLEIGWYNLLNTRYNTVIKIIIHMMGLLILSWSVAGPCPNEFDADAVASTLLAEPKQRGCTSTL